MGGYHIESCVIGNRGPVLVEDGPYPIVIPYPCIMVVVHSIRIIVWGNQDKGRGIVIRRRRIEISRVVKTIRRCRDMSRRIIVYPGEGLLNGDIESSVRRNRSPVLVENGPYPVVIPLSLIHI